MFNEAKVKMFVGFPNLVPSHWWIIVTVLTSWKSRMVLFGVGFKPCLLRMAPGRILDMNNIESVVITKQSEIFAIIFLRYFGEVFWFNIGVLSNGEFR